MLTNSQANRLMKRLIALRERSKKTKDSKILDKLKRHELICIEKFKYLITMHTGQYKSFPNYDDLNQEGYVALIGAMKTFKLNKGSWFYWAHRYISTRVSRAANAHSTIRFPIRYAKKHPPHKETKLPIMIEQRVLFCPEKTFEGAEISNAIECAMKLLNRKQKKIVNIYYGLTGDKPNSISKLCKKMKMSRMNTIKTLNTALELLKQNIQI